MTGICPRNVQVLRSLLAWQAQLVPFVKVWLQRFIVPFWISKLLLSIDVRSRGRDQSLSINRTRASQNFSLGMANNSAVEMGLSAASQVSLQIPTGLDELGGTYLWYSCKAPVMLRSRKRAKTSWNSDSRVAGGTNPYFKYKDRQ